MSEGDRPGYLAPSCVDIDVPIQNTNQTGIVQAYHSCGAKDEHYEPLAYYDSARNAIMIQNAVNCGYTGPGSTSKNGVPIPPCVGYVADQWMTFQIRIKVGTWYKNDGVYRHDSTIQLWVARENQPSVLVIDFNPLRSCTTCGQPAGPTNTGYDLVNRFAPEQKFGKMWLLPYHTGKDPSQVHPTGYVWYDELIISRSKIPDPKAGATGIPPSPPSGLTLQ